MSCFQSFIQSIIGSTCSFFFFKKKLFLYFVASSTHITQFVFLLCLVFSLMRCPNTSFLQDSHFYLHSSLGYSSVLFSPMSSSCNYSPCMSSQPCNRLLWHPSNDVQHVLTLWKYSFDCFPFTIAVLTSSGFLIAILAANKTELPALRTLSNMIGL